LRQRDTYFHAVQGQLKLREAPPALPELIAYVPAELAGPKVSHKAWELDKTERRGHEHKANDVDKPGGLERHAAAAGHTAPGADVIAAQHLRLDLVSQIPERPRRFLLRLALGYSYDEIAELSWAAHVIDGFWRRLFVGDMSVMAGSRVRDRVVVLR